MVEAGGGSEGRAGRARSTPTTTWSSPRRMPLKRRRSAARCATRSLGPLAALRCRTASRADRCAEEAAQGPPPRSPSRRPTTPRRRRTRRRTRRAGSRIVFKGERRRTSLLFNVEFVSYYTSPVVAPPSRAMAHYFSVSAAASTPASSRPPPLSSPPRGRLLESRLKSVQTMLSCARACPRAASSSKGNHVSQDTINWRNAHQCAHVWRRIGGRLRCDKPWPLRRTQSATARSKINLKPTRGRDLAKKRELAACRH